MLPGITWLLVQEFTLLGYYITHPILPIVA